MRYEFRIYWPPRKESVDACADKLHRYLLVLSAAGFKHFYKLGWSKKKAMQSPIALEIANLRQILSRGVNRRDDDRQPIPELGFHVSFWAGVKDESQSYRVSFACGNYHPGFINRGEFKLATSGACSFDQLGRPTLCRLLIDMVQIWEADCGVLCATQAKCRYKNGHMEAANEALLLWQDQRLTEQWRDA